MCSVKWNSFLLLLKLYRKWEVPFTSFSLALQRPEVLHKEFCRYDSRIHKTKRVEDLGDALLSAVTVELFLLAVGP